jgi:CxxC motif-containing protein (DUF1111 family)
VRDDDLVRGGARAMRVDAATARRRWGLDARGVLLKMIFTIITIVPPRSLLLIASLLGAVPACSSGTATVASDAGADAPVSGPTPTPQETREVLERYVDERPRAYSHPARNLDANGRATFALGDHTFNRNWVTAPSSTEGGDGLGPTFNATSCSACHFRDGRGAPPASEDEPFLGLLLRLSVPEADAHGGPAPEPNYGGQVNHRAILGVPPEGRAIVRYEEIAGAYADGEPYSLRSPHYEIVEQSFGPFAVGTMLSPRVAPPMIGLGLLEAVPEATIAALADESSPRAGARVLGRFGWKATQATVEAQTAAAFRGDIGITSSIAPDEDCPAPQAACRAEPSGGAPELDEPKLAATTAYERTLAVPAQRRWDAPEVRRGERLFRESRCAACHVPKLRTGAASPSALAEQTIRPFTDLLLHDMGPELADGRPDFEASGNEWRTPPLWGIGLLSTVSGHKFLLHDGRARGFAEAILWHGGEAAHSREAFRRMSRADCDALLAFLRSL